MMLVAFLLAFVLGVVAAATTLAPRARRDAREIAYLRRRLATSDDCGRSEAVRGLRERAVAWAEHGHAHARLLLALADRLERGERV